MNISKKIDPDVRLHLGYYDSCRDTKADCFLFLGFGFVFGSQCFDVEIVKRAPLMDSVPVPVHETLRQNERLQRYKQFFFSFFEM
jgi:hypothetical protein